MLVNKVNPVFVIVARELIIFHLRQGHYPYKWFLQGSIDHLISVEWKVNVQISGRVETYVICRSP